MVRQRAKWRLGRGAQSVLQYAGRHRLSVLSAARHKQPTSSAVHPYPPLYGSPYGEETTLATEQLR
jgi:hypothetical protein